MTGGRVGNLNRAEENLAIFGGRPLRTTPLAPWPSFQPNEIEAATAVLRSGRVNYWTGEEGKRFERSFAESVGCRYAVALANGTVALEIALAALGIGPGDEVVVPSRTFIASASAVVARGARPVIADVHPDSQNLTADTLLETVTPRTRAVIAVHLAGWPCDMDPILEVARRHDLRIIEDCAQALGAAYKGRSVGSLGHAAAFSFCQDKILTTGGEGGMLTTNDPEVWELAWSLKDHGKGYAAMHRTDWPPGFRLVHERFGTNARMTEIQAAIGNAALPMVPAWVARRRRHAERFSEAFASLEGLRVTTPPPEIEHAYYKYVTFVRPERLRDGWDRDRVMLAIEAEGIPCVIGICSEIYQEQAFPAELRPSHRLPNARSIAETCLLFKVHHTLTDEDVADTCAAVEKVMQVASRS